ncbi:MAG: AzlC family ABC transporter permease [Oscillospiraceae bacterium]|jgi:predicted branched-subunit amino acid permease|nr:AzlC family ABC transporter permease [Oscillospiraceae bacterium]
MSNNWKQGFRDGWPIAVGYFSVSAGFGLTAVSGGMTAGQALLISMTTLTSAGQMAGAQVMLAAGGLIELLVSQLFINMRYALMSIALSQKLAPGTRLPQRMGIAFTNTDEIFAVAASREGLVTPRSMAALAALPYLGWALGTLVGAVAGSILPAAVREGMGLLIYGMFLAIVIPAAKKNAPIRAAVLLAVALRCAFKWVPGLSAVSGGFAMVICALAASAVCAWRWPVGEAS